jgi:hypothetical protein
MKRYTLDAQNRPNILSDPKPLCATGPFVVIYMDVIWPSGTDRAIDVEKIPFDHWLKPCSDIVTPLFKIGKPGFLIDTNEFQNMVLY